MNKTSHPGLALSYEGPSTSQQTPASLHLIPWSVKQWRWLKGLLSLTRALPEKQECLTAAGGRSLAQDRPPFA